jgi:uncharacterized membrane protein YoaK (UPF0700 family)
VSALQEVLRALKPVRGDRHGPLAPLMVALTFVTGVVDAASYLKLGHVFVANMTGNVVFLGFALAGAGGLSILTSLVAIAAFLLGAFGGGWLGASRAEHRGHLLRASSFVQATLIVVAFFVALLVTEPLGTGARYGLIVPLGLAMGVQNAASQRLAIPELTTTVLTKTLTGLASEVSFTGGPGAQPGRRLLAVVTMLLGALTGGLLALHVAVYAALAVAAAVVVGVGIAVHLLSRSNPPWTTA